MISLKKRCPHNQLDFHVIDARRQAINKSDRSTAIGRSRTAKILQLSCSDQSDCGQWALIAPLSEYFSFTFLAKLGNRIFAIGSFLACITTFFQKGFIIKYILFFRFFGPCERTHKQCAWSAYCKSNFEKQDTIFFALFF